MIENATSEHLDNKVRRLMGDELALVSDAVRQGRKLTITVQRPVSFKPQITLLSEILEEGARFNLGWMT